MNYVRPIWLMVHKLHRSFHQFLGNDLCWPHLLLMTMPTELRKMMAFHWTEFEWCHQILCKFQEVSVERLPISLQTIARIFVIANHRVSSAPKIHESLPVIEFTFKFTAVEHRMSHFLLSKGNFHTIWTNHNISKIKNQNPWNEFFLNIKIPTFSNVWSLDQFPIKQLGL